MARQKPRTTRLSLTKEFRSYLETGTFSESFFESLFNLARLSVKKKRWSPQYLGLHGTEWDVENLRELALNFFVDHLCSNEGKRLGYVLDRAKAQEVDALVIKMFDQFLIECSRRVFPVWWNFRGRIKRMMPTLLEEGRATETSERSDMWSPRSPTRTQALSLDDLKSQVNGIPALKRKKYDGEQRVSPEVSEAGLKELLCAVFETAEGPIDLNTLTDFVCHELGVKDAGFDSMELFESEAVQPRSFFPSKIGFALSEMGEAEMRVHVRQVYDRLTPRQKEIFRMVFLEGRSVPEVCAALGVGKSVVYEELQNIIQKLIGRWPRWKK